MTGALMAVPTARSRPGWRRNDSAPTAKTAPKEAALISLLDDPPASSSAASSSSSWG